MVAARGADVARELRAVGDGERLALQLPVAGAGAVAADVVAIVVALAGGIELVDRLHHADTRGRAAEVAVVHGPPESASETEPPGGGVAAGAGAAGAGATV